MLVRSFFVRFETQLGKDKEFREELARVIEASRAEAGCLAIRVFDHCESQPYFAFIPSEWMKRPFAHEEIAFPDWVDRNTPCTRVDILNRLRAGFGLLHFPRAVFEAGLKDPKNNNGRCGSARLTRPFRKAPNRCPIRDSSQKERPTLEFFSQER